MILPRERERKRDEARSCVQRYIFSKNRYDCLVYKLKITLYGVKSKCIIRKGSLNTPTLTYVEMGGW